MSRTSHVYYEVRAMHTFGPPTSIACDIARHLQSRQFLGMTVVVCHNPPTMLSAMRKQWLRLSRSLQKLRASTLNAEEILRFTHTIMHMQHLQFVAQQPVFGGEGHIYFVTPHELNELPPGCFTLYVAANPRAQQLHDWLDTLSADALIVDYGGNLGLPTLNLEPKTHMEQRMLTDWRDMYEFMKNRGVDVSALQSRFGGLHSTAMDDALDALLGSGNEFLRRAAALQHTISLAQPLKNVPATVIKQFETTMRLAHRIQSLTPGNFSHYLVKQFGEYYAESFFLRDAAPEDDDLLDQERESLRFYDMEGVRLTTEYI